MRLRDRLASLSPSSIVRPRAEAGGAPVTGFATSSGIAPALRGGAALEDASRAERIAKLRALITDVVRKDAPQSSQPARMHASRGPRRLSLGELRDTPHGPLHVIERW